MCLQGRQRWRQGNQPWSRRDPRVSAQGGRGSGGEKQLNTRHASKLVDSRCRTAHVSERKRGLKEDSHALDFSRLVNSFPICLENERTWAELSMRRR